MPQRQVAARQRSQTLRIRASKAVCSVAPSFTQRGDRQHPLLDFRGLPPENFAGDCSSLYRTHIQTGPAAPGTRLFLPAPQDYAKQPAPMSEAGDSAGALGTLFFYVLFVHPVCAWILAPKRFRKDRAIIYAILFLATIAIGKMVRD